MLVTMTQNENGFCKDDIHTFLLCRKRVNTRCTRFLDSPRLIPSIADTRLVKQSQDKNLFKDYYLRKQHNIL